MKFSAVDVGVVLAIAIIFLVAGFELGARSVKVSPSEALELSGFILKGKPAASPVMM